MSRSRLSAVTHFQRAGVHLRDGARELEDAPDRVNADNAVEALRQVSEVATVLMQRLAPAAGVDADELRSVLARLRELSLDVQEPEVRRALRGQGRMSRARCWPDDWPRRVAPR